MHCAKNTCAPKMYFAFIKYTGSIIVIETKQGADASFYILKCCYEMIKQCLV